MVTRTAAYRDDLRVYADAVTVYRTALAAATGQVDIICTGFTTNLYELLLSPGDGISPLTGAQLVAAKVRHLWKMGGDYPTGNEYNFNASTQAKTAANYVVANWPSPITFSGFSTGDTILTGQVLKGLQSTDILAQALLDAGYSNGRSSWDSLVVLDAITGDPVRAGYTLTYGSNSVDASTGANTFTSNIGGKDRYVTKAQVDGQYSSRINMLLQRQFWGLVDPYP